MEDGGLDKITQGSDVAREPWVADSYTWMYIVCKQMIYNSFKNKIAYKLFTYKSYIYNHLTVDKQMIV